MAATTMTTSAAGIAPVAEELHGHEAKQVCQPRHGRNVGTNQSLSKGCRMCR
jgi:hypothetical protein